MLHKSNSHKLQTVITCDSKQHKYTTAHLTTATLRSQKPQFWSTGDSHAYNLTGPWRCFINQEGPHFPEAHGYKWQLHLWKLPTEMEN